MTDFETIDAGPALVVGAGLAGLFAALAFKVRPVTILAGSPIGSNASSAWAQGGIAAAVGADDSPALHAADTIAAGAGIVDEAVARLVTEEAAARIEDLVRIGAPFDRDAAGHLVLGREAAHGRRRIVRVKGDQAGAAIMATLAGAVRARDDIRVIDGLRATGLIMADGRARGVWTRDAAGRRVAVVADAVLFALGGAGGLYEVTTNPVTARGIGIAMAARAGAVIADPEFVQFHPTAIDVGLDPMPLATEALRGEGARLIDGEGRFLLGEAADADLQPRDVVARAVHAARAAGRGAFLDCRSAIGAKLAEEFPAVFAACMRAGLDPRETPIPVAAAAHYHMGGIAAGTDGRTSLPGLFAVGECASTGVHGANRLASNSLLEAAAFGRRTGRAAALEMSGAGETLPVTAAADLSPDALQALRKAMSDGAGVVRDAAGLSATLAVIAGLEAEAPGALPLVAARLIAEAALARRESRGGHYRSDYPATAAVADHTHVHADPVLVAAA